MRENHILKSDVLANFYGFGFTGTATPLHDQMGQVIGGIAVQIRRQSELKAIVEQISESLTQANEQINNISYGASSLADYAQQLLIQSQQAGRDVENTTEVLSIIKKVADQTNLLGLNAAIEAAHAASVQHTSAFIEEIKIMSQKLNEFANKL